MRRSTCTGKMATHFAVKIAMFHYMKLNRKKRVGDSSHFIFLQIKNCRKDPTL